MKDRSPEFNEKSPDEIAASEWLARLDRGLTPEEQDQYTEWLAKDAAHRKAIARYQKDWEDYDRLAGIHLKGHQRIRSGLAGPRSFATRPRQKINPEYPSVFGSAFWRIGSACDICYLDPTQGLIRAEPSTCR